MLALRKMRPSHGLALAEVPEPVPGPQDVLIEVGATGICGSDLHIDHWAPSYHFIAAALPVTLGHEICGRVVARGGDVEAPALGQQVVVMPSVTCGACNHCRGGEPERCGARTGIGLTRDGGFAALLAAPARNCLALPAAIDPAVAALAEPLTVAQQAVARGGIAAGCRLLVIGPGAIGLGAALLARRAGAAAVVVCGRQDTARLALARRLGVDHALDLAIEEESAIAELAGDGFDVAIEAAGTPAALDLAVRHVRHGGVVVAAGIYDAPAPVDVTRLVRRQIDLRGSHRSPLAAWRQVIAALAGEPERFAPLITHRVALSQGLGAFAAAHAREGCKIAIVARGQ